MPEYGSPMHISPAAASAAPYTHGLTGVDIPLDNTFSNILWGSIIVLALVIVVGRLLQMGNAHLRHLMNLNSQDQQQTYWSQDKTTIWPWFKNNVLYTPLWKKRHNNEIRLSRAMNVGTLPSRLHMVILVLYLVSNAFYCGYLDYSHSKAAILAELRGRTGHIAVVNMVPLIALAGRNNPLIYLLRVSFDTYNLLHRWIGRVVVLEAVVHTIAWAANDIVVKGAKGPGESLMASPFLGYGMLGTAAFAAILIQSPSVVRHAFYETFLHIHQVLALAAIAGVWIHCHLGDLPGSANVKWAVALWILERCARVARIVYRNISYRRGMTKVTVEAITDEGSGLEACRVSLQLPRPWSYVPGTHAYIYLPSISYWMSHPFSIAWSDSRPTPYLAIDEKLPVSKQDLDQPSSRQTTTIHMVIAKRTGMTATLFNRARASPTGTITIPGLAEGPYGGLDSLHSYGTAILFAAGIGITHQLGHVRDLLEHEASGSSATRKIVLVWSVKSTDTLEWVRPWMDEILAMPNRRQVLRIMIFVTRPRNAKEVTSRSETVQMFPGRCVPGEVLSAEMDRRVGAVGVTVCGPGAFADEVRVGVREVGVPRGTCDFIEEAFTW